MNKLLFNNQEIRTKIENGEMLINLSDTSKCCSLVLILEDNIVSVAWKNVKEILNIIENISASHQFVSEIQATINKIDNLDDRNSIFISKALTKILAVQCNQINYKEYINSLNNNTQVQNTNNFGLMQFNAMAEQMTSVANTITQIGQAFNNIQTYVQDSIQSKDLQIEKISGLIGVRDINVKKLSKNLKARVEETYKMKVWATSKEYKEAKEKLFRAFDVTAWEQIPVLEYDRVNTYINNL